jgi:hypothetical protein
MFRRITATNGVVFYQSDLLESVGVPHAFSTRIGGVSPPPFDALNLGNPPTEIRDDPANVHSNMALLEDAIGCAGRERGWVRQVHGADVVSFLSGQVVPVDSGVAADGLITDDPNRLLGIRTADCVPVLLARLDGRLVCALHAGWRGVIGGIVPAAMRLLQAHGEDYLAAVGPAIGRDAFETARDVADAFTARFGDGVVQHHPAGRCTVDLRQAIAQQLNQAGVARERVDLCELCTHTNRSEFFSHRRDGAATGRMSALIAPRPVR